MSKPENPLAFPEITTDFNSTKGKHGFAETYSYGGMTLRDYFAAKAMHAMIISNGAHDNIITGLGTMLDAYGVADLMLEAREK